MTPTGSPELQAFRAEVTTKLGGIPAKDWIAAHPGEHLFAFYGEYESCAFCGVMKQRKPGGNKRPCRGIVRVELR